MKAFLLAFGVGLLLAGASGAQAYHRFWARCNYDAPTFMTTMTRDAGQDYSNAARYEGYQWVAAAGTTTMSTRIRMTLRGTHRRTARAVTAQA